MNQIRTLFVEESPRIREALRDVFSGIRDVLPVAISPGTAAALEEIQRSALDVVVLSVSAPGLPAAEFTRRVHAEHPRLGILLTARADGSPGEALVEALEAGALDLIVKPGDTAPDAGEVLARRLLPKLRIISAASYARIARELSGGVSGEAPVTPGPGERARSALRSMSSPPRPELVVAGISTGGPEALARLLPALPADLPVPMLIVQHMPEQFLPSLAAALDSRSPALVKVASQGERLEPGVLYLAPGGRNLLVSRGPGGELRCRLDVDPAGNGFRPSVDRLFTSAARTCGGRVLALVLTGMGTDGTDGLRELKGRGARVIAQDEASSVVWGMAGHAVRSDLVDEILSLDHIAARVAEWVGS